MAANETGRIVLATVRNGVAAGAVADRSPGRYSVIVESAQREAWTEDRVFRICEARAPMHSAKAAAEAVASFRERVEAQVEDVDLAALWDLLTDEAGGKTKGWTVEDLTDLLFPAAGPEQRAATAWALALDDVHFRKTTPGQYGPLPREAVEAALKRRQREAQERDYVDRAAGCVSEALEAGEPLDVSTPEARRAVAWLKTLAVAAPDEKETERGLALLERVQPSQTTDPEMRAFALLVRLGVFEEDEVLGIHRHRIRLDFPPALEAEAAAVAAAPLADEELRDRSALEIPAGCAGAFSIDDPWTRDVDDALLVEPLPSGDTVVHVLIADPTAKIAFRSPLGEEGAARASTLYMPHARVPMFPHVLSEDALSLSDSEPRPMLDFACTIGPDGAQNGLQVRPVLATLARRLTYDEVDALVRSGDDGTPLSAAVRRLDALATALRARRVADGAVLIERDDFAVKVADGEVVVHRLPWDSPARRLVAEFMVLACTLAGRFARDNAIPVVYRRQNPPDDKHAAEGLEPGTRAWNFKMLRSLRRAEMTTKADFHWGLGVVAYTQVTSPLRRFQDFAAHVQLKGFLRTGKAPLDADAVLRLFGDLEARGEAVVQTEREAKRYYLLKALKRLEQQVVSGEVVGMAGNRAIVELVDFGLDLPVQGGSHLSPGTPVNLRVRDVDPRRDRVSLMLA